MKIGVLIYTYNRTDDTRINMEIIRNVWKKSEILKDVKIVHSFNGEKEWWPEKYLEDELLYLENPGHFSGAEILLNEGVKTFQEKYSDIDYVIVLASDTWLVMPEYIEKVILGMQKEEKYLGTCVWGSKERVDMFKWGIALDFLILDLKWSRKSSLFPIRFREFAEKYQELFFYHDQTIYLEIVFIARYMQAILRSVILPSDNILKPVAESYVYRMKEREPIHDNQRERIFFKRDRSVRKMYWENIGLITQHDPVPKKAVLKKWNLKLGQYGEKLLSSKDLSYYNGGLRTHSFEKNGKKINYGD